MTPKHAKSYSDHTTISWRNQFLMLLSTSGNRFWYNLKSTAFLASATECASEILYEATTIFYVVVILYFSQLQVQGSLQALNLALRGRRVVIVPILLLPTIAWKQRVIWRKSNVSYTSKFLKICPQIFDFAQPENERKNR